MANYPQVFNFSYNEDVRFFSHWFSLRCAIHHSASNGQRWRWRWRCVLPPCRRTASTWSTTSQHSASRACGDSSPTGALRLLWRTPIHAHALHLLSLLYKIVAYQRCPSGHCHLVLQNFRRGFPIQVPPAAAGPAAEGRDDKAPGQAAAQAAAEAAPVLSQERPEGVCNTYYSTCRAFI